MSRNYLTGTELANLKDEIKYDVRALLCASKDGLTAIELKREFYNLNGKQIPYVELGYNSLHDLLRSYDFIETGRSRNGLSWVFYAQPDENSRDLAKLISGQKDPNKSIREKKRLNEMNRFPRYANNRPGFFTSNFQTQRREAYPSVPTHVPNEVQKNIVEILKRSPNYQLRSKDLEFEYKKITGFELNPKRYGYQSLQSMLQYLNHLFYTEQDAHSNNEFIVGIELSSQEKNGKNLEEEIIENLKLLIGSYKEGIDLNNISQAYADMYSKKLDIQKIGFSSILSLMSEKFSDFIELFQCDESNDFKVRKKQAKSDNNSEISLNSLSSTSKNLHLIKKAVKLIENAFKNHVDVELNEKEFLSIFERHNGFKLNPNDFGFKTLDSLIKTLQDLKIMRIDLDQNFDYIYTYLSEHLNRRSMASGSNTSVVSETDSKQVKNECYDPYEELRKKEHKLYEWRKYQAEFIQDYVLYEPSPNFDKFQLYGKILSQREHNVIMSNVTNPCNFQVQLVENIPSLNELMDNLEKVYYGVGAGYYDMPENYVHEGKYCVAVFDIDKNWHRCRILDVHRDKKRVIIEFIDYGGQTIVPINSLKFLLKEFTVLPPQAIDACFSNIRERPDELWRKDTINYLLNRTVNKLLKAKITGIKNNHICMEIYDRTPQNVNGRPAGTEINLNNRVIMDGYGDKYDETTNVSFTSFDKWLEEYEMFELELEFSKQKIHQATSETLSTNQMSNITPKDHNNNNNNNTNNNSVTSTKSSVKVQYKPIDEMNENSILKEKEIKVPLESKDIYLNILWMDKKRFIHLSQAVELAQCNYDYFSKFITQSFDFHNQNEVTITKFLNKPNNKEVYEWVHNSIGLNLENEKEIYFIVHENLLKFCKALMSADSYAKLNQAWNIKNSKKLISSIELNRQIAFYDREIIILSEKLTRIKSSSNEFKCFSDLLEMLNSAREKLKNCPEVSEEKN
ncbi:unnamed protein product [Brachionus calyciflorus]|uniref:HTH OST-type domain-containing protein n=1 Tax=Brachionus calyciflorus TaxID=104777 RepID=A0A813T309_9BILA|nr:unnamed protein product [Brachionus calyciflorus]